MSVFYPDNPNRAHRVHGLATNVGDLKSRVKETKDAQLKMNKKIYDMLEEGLQREKKPTMADSIKEKLSKSDLEKYLSLQQKFDEHDKALAIVHKVATFVSLTGSIVGLSAIATLSIQYSAACTTVSAALVKASEGGAKVAIELIKASGEIITASRRNATMIEVVDIAAETSKANKIAENIGRVSKGTKILLAVTAILEAGLLIYEAIEGSKRRDMLQKDIRDLCIARFAVKENQMRLDGYNAILVALQATLDFDALVDGLVKDKTIPPEAGEQKKKENREAKFKKALEEMPNITDTMVFNALASMDNLAWTKEDPPPKDITDAPPPPPQ
ncbi:hypothetical protein DFH09DRAFT_1140928 [Mycena vulgaris]|nr:hypothetical protein DFH09DRAFT_1140928 [Mycena vulgaris]